MEMYLYKCTVCGLAHQVPAYWMSFVPELAYEFIHVSLQTKNICENYVLELVEQ